MKKQIAAPAMAEDQDRIAPCHQPKMPALEKVIRKAGMGAARDCRIMSRKDTTAA